MKMEHSSPQFPLVQGEITIFHWSFLSPSCFDQSTFLSLWASQPLPLTSPYSTRRTEVRALPPPPCQTRFAVAVPVGLVLLVAPLFHLSFVDGAPLCFCC